MSIKSREDANNYYRLVNKMVDDFQSNLERLGGKIKQYELKEILKTDGANFKKLISRSELKDIPGIARILSDVIEDRFYMESDGVMTFEGFRFLESEEFKISSMSQCLRRGIGRADISMEKKLADHFNANLGEIDIVDADRHIFKINSWHGELQAIVFSADELEIIKSNIIAHLYDELSIKKVELTSSISVELSDLINKDGFKYKMTKMLTEDFTVRLITDCLFGFYFEKESDGHFIWVSEA